MEHYTMRLGPAAAAAAQQLSWGGDPPLPDRRSRFWQMDYASQQQQRIEVICPQPRRLSRPPFLMEPVTRASAKPNGTLQVYRADSASDILDLILSKNDPDVDTDPGSQVTFFCGSPPVRTNNPVVNDPQFGRNTPSFSPLGSSPFSKMLGGRAEVGSPSCGASSSPKVRIEGFACGNKETQCAVTFA
ncbi:uncharacterized protein LOC124708072 isoform X1 [Lolium rigidum]|uniref:uncharacterized protein LOC124708059 isoform X1 n=1 Tax=Lolium rigidum TaxID=89674 RepID=UPI001F5E15BE|nr:uncharacterized protein LOC124708059 isoform X1 [Lolium rigidum]XP_047095714.1 uncharacterized protein LOC124708072 isoform X1 [Lolium rigidum]